MNPVVCYLMSGSAHLPYLIVSLRTLRQHWKGKVVVYAWPESYPLVCEIAKDKRLYIDVGYREPAYRGKNDQFLDKILMMQSVRYYDVGIYLDADTVVNNDISALYRLGHNFGFCATQFNDWTMDSGVVRGRVQSLLPYLPQEATEHIEGCLTPIDQFRSVGLASVNGGVFACRPESEVLRTWYDWAWAARSVFIADEAVLHTLVHKYLGTQLAVAEGGRWNCSPKYQPKSVTNEQVVIRHYHGDSNVRPHKSLKGFQEWWPMYQSCLQDNVGGINSWIGQINNRWIKVLENSSPSNPKFAGT